MALDAAVEDLVASLRGLGEAVSALHWCIAEDRPPKGAPALVDILEGVAADLLALNREARRCAAGVRKALGPPADLDRVRRRLVAGQQQFHTFSRRYVDDLLVYPRLADLMRLGREKKGEWRGWAAEVSRAIHACQGPLHDANEAYFACWRDLAERTGGMNIAVHAVGVGQKFERAAIAAGCDGLLHDRARNDE